MLKTKYEFFLEHIYEKQEKALEKFVKQVAEKNNVSEEVALYLILKQFNLKFDLDFKNGFLVLTAEPKSVEEILDCIEDITDWEKEMHKRLLCENNLL